MEKAHNIKTIRTLLTCATTDNGVKAEWHFYATSHGKSPCDGIGCTVKRLVAKASLQSVRRENITTPLQMFNWCNQNISGVTFYISSDQIQQHVQTFQLEERYGNSQAIPDTRLYHSFVPDCINNKLNVQKIFRDPFFNPFQAATTTSSG